MSVVLAYNTNIANIDRTSRPYIVLKQLSILFGIGLLGYGAYYAGLMMRVLTGFGAKQLCSCVFVSQRTAASVLADDLNRFPYRLAKYHVNYQDQSTTSQLGPWSLRRAVHRPGLGCVLLTATEQTPEPRFFDPPRTQDQPLPQNLAMSSVNYAQLDAALAQAFAEPDLGHLQNTKAVVVLYRDTLVAERYAPGHH